MSNINGDTPWKNGEYINNENVKQLLENRAQTLKPMDGFQLSNTNLANINLVHSGDKHGFQLINSNLYKCDFSNAHCFKMDFSGSSLMKANFENANLHCANLTNCNLLGTKFENAKLENVVWDRVIIQEREAENAKSREEQIDFYQQAEEIYRNIRRIAEADGLFETAGYFFQKEMQMRRKKFPRFSFKRIFSKFVDLSCGYGERPIRIILISLFLISFFSIAFFIFGIFYNGEVQKFSAELSTFENVEILLNSLYFSVVTFTTLGYGDIIPIGITKLFAAIEAFMGGFILAIFVIVFVKKMTR